MLITMEIDAYKTYQNSYPDLMQIKSSGKKHDTTLEKKIELKRVF